MLVIKDGVLVCNHCHEPIIPEPCRPSAVNMATVSLGCGCGYYIRLNSTGLYAVEFITQQKVFGDR